MHNLRSQKNKKQPRLKRIATALMLLALPALAHAQQYNQWAFGMNASYNFTTQAPVTPAPTISTIETAASWCNNAGNLWIYTNGKNIYNAQSGLTCGGCLNGNPNSATNSAIQGVLILPKIGGPADQFYIFTVSDRGILSGNINYGLTYDVYNASSNSINGETSMGFAMNTYGSFTTEALTAIPHANGTDYWVIVKSVVIPPGTPGATIGSTPPPNQPAGGNNNSLYAYLVTAAGVTPQPVVSNAGFASDYMGGFNLIQEIRCSPDRQFVAVTNRTASNAGSVFLYRFNDATGEFGYLQTLPMPATYCPWSISFSPNSRVLYATGNHPATSATDPAAETLRQFDLSTVPCSPSVTPAYCDYNTTVPFSSSSKLTKLQLTPDGRIFRTRKGSYYIDVISTPNNVGCANMGYQATAIQVATSGTNNSEFSLPNNIDAKAGPVGTTEWPKTTTLTNTQDKGVMTDLDQFGDIYSAGEFKVSTQFETVNITGHVNGAMYLTKYDNCNGLEWVAKGVPALPGGSVTCTSMSTGPSINSVMVTGRFSGPTTFSSAVNGSGVPVCGTGLSITGAGIYIAIYDFNGCLLGVKTIQNDATYTHNSSHITIGRLLVPATGITENRVYVAVNETPVAGNNDRVRVFCFVHSSPATLTNAWVVPLKSSSSILAYDISSYKTTVAVTGHFQRDISWNTNVTPFASGASGISEAFVASMADVNNLAIPNNIGALTAGFDPVVTTNNSYGMGVKVYSTNDVLLTGTYNNAVASTFGTGLGMAGNGSFSCAYAVRMNSTTPASNWVRSVMSDGFAYGVDITQSGSMVYLTGMWEGTTFGINGTVLPTAVPLKNHMYVVGMEVNGSYTTAPCWQNHSYLNSDLTDFARPARIAANANYVYVNGVYKGTNQMEDDIAFNSPLTSTAGTSNSFVWRYNVPNGMALRESQVAAAAAESTMQLYPNPVNQTLFLTLGNADTEAAIEVYNTSGQVIYSARTMQSNTQIDVADWAPGIYLVRMVRNGEVITEKIIKQ
ncbi:MAG: T9SS type A sorting domain-containing protein [Bacteroidetes bacterium]|nr:T9SS type A sorting domain-containing protein [Bacteroidota bacterium]